MIRPPCRSAPPSIPRQQRSEPPQLARTGTRRSSGSASAWSPGPNLEGFDTCQRGERRSEREPV